MTTSRTTPSELLEMDLSSGSGDDWQVTPHGRFLGQMLAEHNLVSGKDVLELGAGLANHTILLARQGAKSIVATEIHADFLESTRENFRRNCPNYEAIDFRVADWLNLEGQYDVVVTNPPFAKSGKQNRRYFIDSLILDGHKRLRDTGSLLFVQSSMADVALTESRLDQNGFDVVRVGEQQNPFRDYYFGDESFMREIERVENGYERRGDEYWETLIVLHATKRPWTPPAGAHLPPST